MAVGVLLSLFALQAVLSLRGKFTTFDEGYYLSGGYSYLVTGDTGMVNRFHPPLAQVLVALPLAGLDLEPPERDPAWWLPKSDLSSRTFALNFLYRNRAPWQTILTRGRLMMVGLGVVVGLVVFLWALELRGVRAGLLALVLYTFSPNLLAHARLTTTDFAVAGLSFAACYALWRFYRQPGLLRLILAGLLLGLALLSKLSALIFCPVVVLLSILYVLAPPRHESTYNARPGETDERAAPTWGRRLAIGLVAVLVVAVVACGVIWLGYAGATGPGTKEQF
ncbi:MAG: glycosyltransferase family 39 protein, partial [Planctomycetes bacterium]|nr:glycosyltransferase family 39 protein [Planctomycetota bacterium]